MVIHAILYITITCRLKTCGRNVHSLQDARYYLASHLQDVSYSEGCKIIILLTLQDARYYLASHLQDVSYSAGCKILSCKMHLTLQNARYYLASHLQDVSYSKMLLDDSFKILSRKLYTCLNLEIYLQDIFDGVILYCILHLVSQACEPVTNKEMPVTNKDLFI